MSRRARLLACFLLAGAVPASAAAAERAASHPARISVSVVGSGPDVVLIPGLAASRSIWKGTVAALPGYRYHLVQIAGFAGAAPGGNSAGPVAGPVAAEIARYIAAAGLKRPAIVGHSMGGSIAMMLAARHPDAAGRVMIVDMLPSPARPFGLAPGSARPFARLLAREVRGADRLRQDLKAIVGRFGSADWLDSGSDAGVVSRSLEELVAADLTPELRRIRVPMTVLYACPQTLNFTCGRIGRTYTRAYSVRPGTRIVRVERSGHTIMHDQPAAFRAILTEFLR